MAVAGSAGSQTTTSEPVADKLSYLLGGEPSPINSSAWKNTEQEGTCLTPITFTCRLDATSVARRGICRTLSAGLRSTRVVQYAYWALLLPPRPGWSQGDTRQNYAEKIKSAKLRVASPSGPWANGTWELGIIRHSA